MAMDKAKDYEGAVIQINNSIRELEKIILSDRIEGVKVLEFFLSFNPAIFNQDDLSIKMDAWRFLDGHCKAHARLIVEQSISFDIPIWKTYREKIQKVIDLRREVFSV
ncbi:TPA: hypothetical protein ACNV18_000724 [Pseudomonas putida]|uniref:Uncharacterized protein n=2 Tax=Pseudomonas putida TaxID=303 RepID=A0A4D6XCN4_PSEPU|nr:MULTISPECIES: hypothetical protein [Pseudomonas]MBA1318875.1 hypothetical protein [Pseudomonas monteilii]MBA6136219.1 hypothetical protein [Pseudomonas monteilii]MCE0989545.1 hypothetical protein [Pseudomonas alloputida]MCE1060697.1 hypothetical protein [Pseudomonas alloputida]MDH0023529.1 hypothetical protein [Pseudomonas monteilii]